MNGRGNVLVATLRKYGYDLDFDEENTSALRESTSDLRSSISSSSILQLREKKNNQTAFHIAAKKGHMDVLKALCKLPRANEHFNLGDRHGNTALHFAACNQKDCAPEMVEFLIVNGANVAATNVRGQTPLAIHLMTLKDDSPAVVRAFFKRDVKNINELVGGTTYLHMALEKNLVEVGGALVTGGASINIPDANGVMVSDNLARKTLVRWICFMKEGTQRAPAGISRNCCKMCKTGGKDGKDLLKDCNMCGRTVCKSCSKKASEVKHFTSPVQTVNSPSCTKPREKGGSYGRFCNVCTTVVMLRDKHQKVKDNFHQKLYGMSMK